jgi:hypothetical protein
MAKLEFVAGVVDRLALVEAFLEQSPEVIAEELLRASLVDAPRPPWRSGELRSSGAVYIGGRLFMTTPEVAAKHGVSDLLGPNPKFAAEDGHIYRARSFFGRASNRHLSGIALVPKRLRKADLLKATERSGSAFTGLRNKITLYYHAPHAAIMHEWAKGFSDPLSGAHYISSKLGNVSSRASVLLKQVFYETISR